MRTDVVARLEQLQLAGAYDPQVWGRPIEPLWREVGVASRIPRAIPLGLYLLTALDNVDKHRVIHTAWYGSAWYRGDHLGRPPGSLYAVAHGHRLIFRCRHNGRGSRGGRPASGTATPQDLDLRLEY